MRPGCTLVSWPRGLGCGTFRWKHETREAILPILETTHKILNMKRRIAQGRSQQPGTGPNRATE